LLIALPHAAEAAAAAPIALPRSTFYYQSKVSAASVSDGQLAGLIDDIQGPKWICTP
jgi:hypothetical protein